MDDGGADVDGSGMDGGGIIPSVRAPPCFWTSPGGSTFNLQGMKQLGHDFTGTTAGGYTYRFNMCGGTVKVCNGQPAPASKWRGTKCNNLGDMQTQEISLLDEHDASKGLRLVYRDGDICKKQVNGQVAIGSRQVTYEIECDRGSDSGVLQRIVETSMCDYTILFQSRHACPTNGIAGSRGGSRRSAGCDAQAGQHGTRLPVGLQPGGEVELTLAYKPSSGLATRYKLLGLCRAS